MRTMLKTIALLGFVAIAATWLISPVNATVICDFENGSDNYDNAVPQSEGKFRDTNHDAHSDLSDNGTNNDYLILKQYVSGNPTTTAYDTTPGDTSPSLFYTPIGATTTVTIDMEYHQWARALIGGLAFFDPVAAGGGSEGFMFTFLDFSSGNDKVRLRSISNNDCQYSGTTFFYETLSAASQSPILRLSVSLLNNGTTASVTTRIDTLSALEGTVSVNLWNGTQVLTYGTEDGQINMDPATNGFEVLLMRTANTSDTGDSDIYFDRLTVNTIPEPSTFALLATGLIGLLAYAWRKRK